MLTYWGSPNVHGQAITKTYTAPSSVTVDGCGTYCNSLPGVSFSVNDFNQGCEIADVNVSITWAKTDGTCSAPGIGDSRHNETSFRIDGPAGNVVLATSGTWSGAATTSRVTTVFDQAAASIPSGTPVSGTFRPNNGNLNTLNGGTPYGTWTLRAGDTSPADPLCIVGYSVTVTAQDVTDPTINCPANVTAQTGVGSCQAVVTYTTPVGTDNCSGASTQRTSGNGSGALFSVGNTTEQYTVTDAVGRTASCSFIITVVDLQDPQINCPPNITVNNATGNCSSVVPYTNPVGTDNCSGATTQRTSGLGGGSTFPVGTSTETYVVTDPSGNTDSCSFTVTVLDAEPPTINCPSNQVATAGTSTCTAVVNFAAPVGTDNCTGATTTLVAGSGSGSPFPIGVTTQRYRVTDGAGNQDSCTFTVTVLDQGAPAISCPPNLTANADQGQCSAVVTYTVPNGTDNCSPATTAQSAGVASGGAFPVGVTTNTFVVTDSAGNTSNCSFDVTVLDNQNPVATCPQDTTITNDNGSCTGTYTYPNPTGTDNCGIQNVVLASGQGSGGAFPFGTNTETWTISDSSGNTAQCSFVVTVINNFAVTAIVDQDATCDGVDDGQATANYNGGCPGYTFLWSDGQTTQTAAGLGAGTYTVTVTDGSGATGVDTVVITNLNSVSPTIVPNTNGDTLCAQPPGSTYQWFLGGAAITGANSQCIVPTFSGQYTVQVTDNSGCQGTSPPLDFVVGVEEGDDLTGILLFPNPTTGILNIRVSGIVNSQIDFEVFDLSGRILKSGSLGPGHTEDRIDLSGHATGMYFVRIHSETKTTVRKFILE